jgi:hypothetical protein
MTQVPRKYLFKALFTGQTLSVNHATLRALVELAAAESVETDVLSDAWCDALIDRWLGENARRVNLWPTR